LEGKTIVPAIEFVNVSKKYSYLQALNSLSMKVEGGEHVAILGPNGAGKTTLIRMVATHIFPSRGVLKIHGQDAFKNSEDARRRVGFVAHKSFLYDELTIAENLVFYGRMFSVKSDFRELIELLNLKKWYKTATRNLSHGLRKRADIARALIHNPDILLLDELFAGLDEETRWLVIRYLRDQHEKTLLMSSHSVEWARQLCQREIFLEKGRLVRDCQF
jgi:ABC-type multidrug transport system ATPase subunit